MGDDMHNKSKNLFIGASAIAVLALAACGGESENKAGVVSDQQSFDEAVKVAAPGDVITLANGTWEDFEILFTGQGEEENPIRLVAETPGKVILSGQSNLRLAGEYLEVSGLVFKDGYTPTSEVVSFRKNSKEFANNSRITNIVIDNYNQPERQETPASKITIVLITTTLAHVKFWALMVVKHCALVQAIIRVKTLSQL